MVKNHEAKVPLSVDEFKSLTRFWLATFPDMKKSGFYRTVFIMGLKQIKREAIKQGKESTLKKILD